MKDENFSKDLLTGGGQSSIKQVVQRCAYCIVVSIPESFNVYSHFAYYISPDFPKITQTLRLTSSL